MEDIVMVALAPFYVMGVCGAGFVTAKLIDSFTESAQQTQLKETLQQPGTGQVPKP